MEDSKQNCMDRFCKYGKFDCDQIKKAMLMKGFDCGHMKKMMEKMMSGKSTTSSCCDQNNKNSATHCCA